MNCEPVIEMWNSPGSAIGHTIDDVRPDGSLGTQPRVIINAAGLSQQHRDQLIAHEMVHARWACAEAQGQPRPHVGVEEVQAYWQGGTCDAGGYHRQSHCGDRAGDSPALKCECVERNAVASCEMAGLPADDCRRVVRHAITAPPYNCP